MRRGIDWVWDLRRLTITPDNPVVFDIGANIGQTTAQILQIFPRAIIHAFEPAESTFKILHRKFAAMPSIQCNRLAVSEVCGSAKIIAAVDSQLSHLASQSEDSSRLETIKTISIDAYCAENAINHIDILKTDTEGHDLAVLKGGKNTLRAGRIDWILVEVTFDLLDDVHSHFEEIQIFLRGYGMMPYCFYDHVFTHADRHHLFCNVLFVRQEFSLRHV
jgi:FkbM family methyltransferase